MCLWLLLGSILRSTGDILHTQLGVLHVLQIVTKATGVASNGGIISGAATALQAVQQASTTLRTLYSRDCVVYVIWKTADVDSAVLTEAASEAQEPLDSCTPADLSALVTRGILQQQQMQQQQLSVKQSEPFLQQAACQTEKQQQQQQVMLPPRSYKLLLISCDVGKPTSGWHQPGVAQSQSWRKPRGLPDDKWDKQQQWRQQNRRKQQQHRSQQRTQSHTVVQDGSSEQQLDRATGTGATQNSSKDSLSK